MLAGFIAATRLLQPQTPAAAATTTAAAAAEEKEDC